MLKLNGILEIAIHTEDMARSRAFYDGVLGLEPIYRRPVACLRSGKGTTGQTVTVPSGTIPGHGGDGVVCGVCHRDEVDPWEAHLASRDVCRRERVWPIKVSALG